MVIATQNPVEHHGTYPLPESQLDRFLMRIRIGYPDAAAEREIRAAQRGAGTENIRPVISSEELGTLQEAVARVKVDDALVDYMLAIVEQTRDARIAGHGREPARRAGAVPGLAGFGGGRRPRLCHAGRRQTRTGGSRMCGGALARRCWRLAAAAGDSAGPARDRRESPGTRDSARSRGRSTPAKGPQK